MSMLSRTRIRSLANHQLSQNTWTLWTHRWFGTGTAASSSSSSWPSSLIVPCQSKHSIRHIKKDYLAAPWSLSSSSFSSQSLSGSKTTKTSTTSKMKLPPNLKIDPRSKLAPLIIKGSSWNSNLEFPKEENDFKNLQSFKEEASHRGNVVSEQQRTTTTSEDNDNNYDNDHDLMNDNDDDFWLESSTPRYVIPLPERLHVSVYDKTDFRTIVGSIHLASSVFGQDPIRVDLIKRVVQYQRNKKRGKRYPALTKTVSTVSGSGKKVRPQKGGGTARAGHKRPAHWRGGAKAHGPKGKIQDYETKLNKHTRRLGLIHALSQKLKEGNLMVMNDFNMDTHKTRQLARTLSHVGLSGANGSSAYIVDWADNDDPLVSRNLPLNLAVGAGNLPRVKVSTQLFTNVYDLLKHEKLILSLGAIQALEARLSEIAY